MQTPRPDETAGGSFMALINQPENEPPAFLSFPRRLRTEFMPAGPAAPRPLVRRRLTSKEAARAGIASAGEGFCALPR